MVTRTRSSGPGIVGDERGSRAGRSMDNPRPGHAPRFVTAASWTTRYSVATDALRRTRPETAKHTET
jgi:hypothetical protein